MLREGNRTEDPGSLEVVLIRNKYDTFLWIIFLTSMRTTLNILIVLVSALCFLPDSRAQFIYPDANIDSVFRLFPGCMVDSSETYNSRKAPGDAFRHRNIFKLHYNARFFYIKSNVYLGHDYTGKYTFGVDPNTRKILFYFWECRAEDTADHLLVTLSVSQYIEGFLGIPKLAETAELDKSSMLTYICWVSNQDEYKYELANVEHKYALSNSDYRSSRSVVFWCAIHRKNPAKNKNDGK